MELVAFQISLSCWSFFLNFSSRGSTLSTSLLPIILTSSSTTFHFPSASSSFSSPFELHFPNPSWENERRRWWMRGRGDSTFCLLPAAFLKCLMAPRCLKKKRKKLPIRENVEQLRLNFKAPSLQKYFNSFGFLNLFFTIAKKSRTPSRGDCNLKKVKVRVFAFYFDIFFLLLSEACRRSASHLIVLWTTEFISRR